MTRRSIVLLTGLVALIVFGGGALFYDRYGGNSAQPVAAAQGDALVRAHSPIIGMTDAPVTIVEFLDPSCEACRAFYPAVMQIMANFPDETRLVIRYTPFHEGSEEAVRILKTARLQDRFEPVLEALLAQQPEWAVLVRQISKKLRRLRGRRDWTSSRHGVRCPRTRSMPFLSRT